MATLKEKYDQETALKLKDVLGVSNSMMVPRVLKVVINMGLGAADKDVLKTATDELAAITGQKPVINRARKSK